MSTETRYLSCAETAKLVRAAIGEAFPGVKFSVRSSNYSGGASIRVSWTDGPTVAQVKPFCDAFEGSYFDGMIDYKGSKNHTLDGMPVSFAADFIFEERSHSDLAIETAIAAVVERYRCPAVTVEQYRNGQTWNTPVCQNATADSYSREIRAALECREGYFPETLAAWTPCKSPTLARVKFAGSDEYGAPFGARGYPNPSRSTPAVVVPLAIVEPAPVVEPVEAIVEMIDAATELAAALRAIVDEAGPLFGLDNTPGTINRMAYLARAALAKVTQ